MLSVVVLPSASNLCTLTLWIRDFISGTQLSEKKFRYRSVMSLAPLSLFPMISSWLREMSVQTGWGLDRGFSVLGKYISIVYQISLVEAACFDRGCCR